MRDKGGDIWYAGELLKDASALRDGTFYTIDENCWWKVNASTERIEHLDKKEVQALVDQMNKAVDKVLKKHQHQQAIKARRLLNAVKL